MTNKIINLGIFAHVDAGKTTLTEQMLFTSGAIKSAGNVDKGPSHTDKMDVEKERGISVRSASVSFNWNDVKINLIDTPGHVDFSAEVERSLQVVDCALLILSAVEGIQAQTEKIWKALRQRKIPTIFFINKIDRVGADTASLLAALKNEFSNDIELMNKPVDEAENRAYVEDCIKLENESLVAAVSEKDELLMEKYLGDEAFSISEIMSVLIDETSKSEFYPCCCGVAKNNIGVTELLDVIVKCFPGASRNISDSLSGIVYKIEHDSKLGRIAGVRLFSGKLNNRDSITNYTAQREEKVTQIKVYLSDRFEDTPSLEAGDIGFICGMPEAKIGDILGDPSMVPKSYSLGDPLLSVKVTPNDAKDFSALAEALQILGSEDPHLNFIWFKDENELQVNIMGKIQIEILTGILENRFDIGVRFSPPTVIYKETPSKKGIGFESYTMPKPCWAVVKFEISPGEMGSGIIYNSKVGVNKIHQKYQNEIEMILPQALKQGIKGWEITDAVITLVDGEDHVIHSRPGDFKLATLMGIMKGLKDTGTDFLEPIIDFKITAPEEFLGKITSDIINMRGSFLQPDINNGIFILTGKYPLATSLEYSIRLNSLTGGKAKLANKFGGYEKCSTALGEIKEYRGVHPLDRSKYILKWRGALS